MNTRLMRDANPDYRLTAVRIHMDVKADVVSRLRGTGETLSELTERLYMDWIASFDLQKRRKAVKSSKLVSLRKSNLTKNTKGEK